jgi:nucleotide-binding universal stress UspA family protein
MPRSIIAAVDRSAEATEVARVAASLARRLDRRLVLAQVVGDSPVFPYRDSWRRETRRWQATRRGTELLNTIATEIGEPAARRRVALGGALHGPLEQRLDALADEERAELLVVGSRARGALARAAFGSLSASMAESGARPVVVVPAGARDRLDPAGPVRSGPILCGIDGSGESDRARIVAEEIAGRLGLEVLPVYVDPRGPWRDAPEEIRVKPRDADVGLADVAARTRAPLIVVGTRGRGPLHASVARNLMSMAPAPVLVVSPYARLPRFAGERESGPALAA